MAAGHGFLTATADSAYGSTGLTLASSTNDGAKAERFQCPGSGTVEISEIGGYLSEIATGTLGVKFSIWEDDAVNNCPESMVANSESDEKIVSGSGYIKYSHTYATKPQLTGGQYYWLAAIGDHGDANHRIYGNTTGGSHLRSIQDGSITYPTWPDGAGWEGSSDLAYEMSIYAVYEEAEGALTANPGDDIVNEYNLI